MITRYFWLMGALLATALLGACARTPDSPGQAAPTFPAEVATGTISASDRPRHVHTDKHAGELPDAHAGAPDQRYDEHTLPIGSCPGVSIAGGLGSGADR